MSTEVDQKIERLLNLMIDESLDAIILATRRNLSWITGGRRVLRKHGERARDSYSGNN